MVCFDQQSWCHTRKTSRDGTPPIDRGIRSRCCNYHQVKRQRHFPVNNLTEGPALLSAPVHLMALSPNLTTHLTGTFDRVGSTPGSPCASTGVQLSLNPINNKEEWLAHLSAPVHLQARAVVPVHNLGRAAPARKRLHHAHALQPLPCACRARQQPLCKRAARLEVARVQLNLLQSVIQSVTPSPATWG